MGIFLLQRILDTKSPHIQKYKIKSLYLFRIIGSHTEQQAIFRFGKFQTKKIAYNISSNFHSRLKSFSLRKIAQENLDFFARAKIAILPPAGSRTHPESLISSVFICAGGANRDPLNDFVRPEKSATLSRFSASVWRFSVCVPRTFPDVFIARSVTCFGFMFARKVG